MNGPRERHTGWNKSNTEKQIPYINAYMWDLQKWYRGTYVQSRNRDTDVENKHTDSGGGGGGVGCIGRLGLAYIHD